MRDSEAHTPVRRVVKVAAGDRVSRPDGWTTDSSEAPTVGRTGSTARPPAPDPSPDGHPADAPFDADAPHRIDPALAELARLERLALELRHLVRGVPREVSRCELSAMWHLAHAINELATLMRGDRHRPVRPVAPLLAPPPARQVAGRRRAECRDAGALQG